jgi:hypothetical protein
MSTFSSDIARAVSRERRVLRDSQVYFERT